MMISPEVLRRFPFFGALSEQQIKSLAMIAEEMDWEASDTVFEIGDPAEWLYLLKEGSVDLFDIVKDTHDPEKKKVFLVGEVNPGEIFGVSALLEPHKLMATAIAAKPSSGIRLDATRLKELGAEDPELECLVLKQLAAAILERLMHTRVQLAAARA